LSASLRFVVFSVEGMSTGQHALMQDSRNQNTTAPLSVEYDMPAMLMPAQTRTNVFAKPAQRRIASQGMATGLKLADVAGGLGLAPFMKSVIADAQ
jgi:hypothetical protein